MVEPNNPSPAIVSVTKITFSLDSNKTSIAESWIKSPSDEEIISPLK